MLKPEMSLEIAPDFRGPRHPWPARPAHGFSRQGGRIGLSARICLTVLPRAVGALARRLRRVRQPGRRGDCRRTGRRRRVWSLLARPADPISSESRTQDTRWRGSTDRRSTCSSWAACRSWRSSMARVSCSMYIAADSMADIPENGTLLEIIDRIQARTVPPITSTRETPTPGAK